MSITFKMYLPVIIIAVITIISILLLRLSQTMIGYLEFSLSALSYLQLSFR